MSGKKVTINDVLERLEGVVNEMNNGFSKNQVSLESLSTKVSELRCVSCKVQALWTPSGTNHNGQIGNLS